MIDLLDYDLIRRHPKPFLGMSDITIYQWAMWTQAGLVGFHACLSVWRRAWTAAGGGWRW